MGAVQIEGHGWHVETTARYDYATDPHHCPICGGVGWVWHGYFSCDGTCHAVAVVADGRTFVPVNMAGGTAMTPAERQSILEDQLRHARQMRERLDAERQGLLEAEAVLEEQLRRLAADTAQEDTSCP